MGHDFVVGRVVKSQNRLKAKGWCLEGRVVKDIKDDDNLYSVSNALTERVLSNNVSDRSK
jgi:hypothetical protein